jgi:hypothetical protein
MWGVYLAVYTPDHAHASPLGYFSQHRIAITWPKPGAVKSSGIRVARE